MVSFETLWYFLGFFLAYSIKEKRRTTKAQKFSKNELKHVFLTLNKKKKNKK